MKQPTYKEKLFRNLLDLCHRSILNDDLATARKAWSILIRSKGFKWVDYWHWGYSLCAGNELRFLRLAYRSGADKSRVMREILFHYMAHDEPNLAYDELMPELETMELMNDPVLHEYAGMLAMKMAKSASGTDQRMLDKARLHFIRSLDLQVTNQGKAVSEHYLGRIDQMQR